MSTAPSNGEPSPRLAPSDHAPNARWRLASFALDAYAVLYCIAVLVRNRAPGVTLMESVGFFPLYCAAGVGVWVGSGAPGLGRREVLAWRSIALGWLLSLAGAAAYLVRGVPVVLHAGDVLYRSYYPLLVVGFLLLGSPSPAPANRARQWIDAAIVVLAALTLSWFFVWGVPEVRAHLRLVAPIDGIVPFGEVAVLMAAGVALVRTHDRSVRRAVEFLGVGALAASLGDLLLLRSDALASFTLQSVGDIMLAASAAMFMRAGTEARRVPNPPRRAVSSVLPYASLTTVGVLVAFEVVQGGEFSGAARGLIAGAIALAALVIARLVLAEREARAQVAARLDQDRRFRALAQRSGEALLLVDAGVVTYASESAARVFHLDPERVVGSTLDRLGVPDGSPLQRALQHPQDGALVQWEARLGDATRSFETIVSDRRSDPAVRGIVLTTRDVSERVALERRLLQAQKLDALGLLAGGVAHDFNNLLAAIRANADLLRYAPTGDPTHELVEIQRATERGAALCRQLLTFGRPTEGARRYFALAAAVRDTLPMLRRVLPSSIALEVAVHDEGARVHADRGQVEVALLNLVLNARDAMPDAGTITLDLSSVSLAGSAAERAGVAPGDYVQLRVEDTGEGMDADTLGRVLEPFFTTKGRGGTGLGLPMVYGVMKGIGGDVVLRSTPGSGTVVTLYFPRAPEGAATEAERVPHPTGGRGAGRVLLVDDEPAVRDVMSKWLTRSGYQVLVAEDGAAALELLEREGWQVDALVSDIVMPRVNGIALATRVHAARPDLRIILMSGFESVSGEGGAPALPHVVRLQKPFPLATLLAQLQGLVTNDQKPPATDR